MFLNPLIMPVLLGAALLYLLGRRLTHPLAWGVAVLLAVPALVLAGYYVLPRMELGWFYAFRAAPYSELTAAGFGLLAGMLHPAIMRSPARLGRYLVAGLYLPACLAILAIPYLKPVLMPVGMLPFHDEWADGVCIQTTPSTCGPASAATLLRHFGKAANERQLARECHSCMTGTENWYLVRALRRRGVPVRYQITAHEPAKLPTPAIAGVRLPGGVGHFITVLGRTDTGYIIGDPCFGRSEATRAALADQYQFTGFFLVADEPVKD